MKIAPRAAALAAALSAAVSLAADIVLTPPPSGGVSMTNAAGDQTRFRVADDGTATLNGNLDLPNSGSAGTGNILKGGVRFLHNTGTNSTFVGVGAGNFTNTGFSNNALGVDALSSITQGGINVAMGRGALRSTTIGNQNTAMGGFALSENVDGIGNAAFGNTALFANTAGSSNTAIGARALSMGSSGSSNTALGAGSLEAGVGSNNVAVGVEAGQTLNGNNNILIGASAGLNLTTGSSNIIIGNAGVASENATTRIGGSQTKAFISGIRGVTTGANNGVAVLIDTNGQLGTVSSSERFKDDIADMDAASDALMQLRPVTFHYKADQDPAGARLQYGLVAEEVAQVYPGLVVATPDGQAETVMYHYLPPMLLNEVQKQRRTIERLERELAEIRKALGLPQESR